MRIIKVSNNIFRGKRPKSFANLKEKKIKIIFNLQSGAYEKLTNTEYEHENAMDFGMIEIDWKMSDYFPPTVNGLLNIVRVINLLGRKVPVFIHCLHGKDRTGIVCAAYRILIDKWPYDLAINEMKSLGFHGFPYFFWKRNLKKLEVYKNDSNFSN